MSRTTKSVAAVGAGILLLTAAGGTFAQWSESETVDGGTITAGHLDMTVSAGTWHDANADAVIDPATFTIVPGDVLEYRATITPDLVGDNLEAELESDLSTATGDLADFVETSATLGGAASQTLTPADNGTSYDAVVRVEMPYGAGTVTDPNGGEDLTLDLSTLEISLVQTTNP
ncbi:alternate-type signal peptide domain-containing protein [Janibacter sp. GS2]|uniref:alternate-type signal peptide domain-containing protein n=1 Tax=Janibacter sp. GS2 TaxID=3442646 RepID=UPI003EBA8300